MKKEIGILVVADSPATVGKIKRALRRAGLPVRARCAATRDVFCHELNHHRPDVVLANHGPPAFDGEAALALASEKRPDVPFIFVADPVQESMDKEGPRAGSGGTAWRSPLARLGPTVRRALREARKRAWLFELELRALTARWRAR